MQIDSLQVAHMLYDESKFWIALTGALWSVFKGISWARNQLDGFKTSLDTIRSNDLHHIQLGVNDLKSGLDSQTHAVVNELRELRNDFRTLYRPVSRRKPRR